MTTFSPGLPNVVRRLARTSQAFAIPDGFPIVGTSFCHLWHDNGCCPRSLLTRQRDDVFSTCRRPGRYLSAGSGIATDVSGRRGPRWLAEAAPRDDTSFASTRANARVFEQIAG